MTHMQQISYGGQAAAMAGRERFWLVDELALLDAEDPVRLWVSWLCLYARDVLTGNLPGPYEQATAERFAREALMPEDAFLDVAHTSEPEIASLFGVPLEQVRPRYLDLADRLLEL